MISTNPVNKLLKSIASSSVSDLSDKLGEVALDNFIDHALLKDIPIIGTALSILKAGNDVQAYLFTKKVVNFLIEVEEVPQNKRVEFVNKYSDEKGSFDKVGESILMVIDSSNSSDTATYLGKAVKLYILGELDSHTFEIYVHIISNLSPYIINQLHQSYKYSNAIMVNGDALHYLSNLGLLIGKISLQKNSELILIPNKSKLGQAFYSHIFE